MPVAIRNNTQSVLAVSVRGVLHEPDGNELGSGDTFGIYPGGPMKPGELGFGYIHFDVPPPPLPWPKDATFAFQVNSTPWTPNFAITGEVLPMKVISASMAGGTITGAALNASGVALKLPIVAVFCFDTAGNLEKGIDDINGAGIDARVSPQDAAPGTSEQFQIDLSGTLCERFLVAVSGSHQS